MTEINRELIDCFQFQGEFIEGIPYGSGHINDTFRLTFRDDDKIRRYILQDRKSVV